MRMQQYVSIAVLSLYACGHGSAGEPAPVVTVPPGGDKCAAACDHMSKLNNGDPCEEATDVDTGDGGKMTCTEFCQYQHANGVYWGTECLTAITDCSQIEGCATSVQ